MAGFGVADNVSGKHGLLIQRASAVAATLVREGSVTLVGADASAAPVGGQRQVALLRGSPAMGRNASRAVVSYADPTSESALAMTLAAMAGPGEPIAADPESLAVFALADRLAVSDIPVLINGPTGTGKEVLSRFIHARSKRAAGPFIAVNCDEGTRRALRPRMDKAAEHFLAGAGRPVNQDGDVADGQAIGQRKHRKALGIGGDRLTRTGHRGQGHRQGRFAGRVGVADDRAARIAADRRASAQQRDLALATDRGSTRVRVHQRDAALADQRRRDRAGALDQQAMLARNIVCDPEPGHLACNPQRKINYACKELFAAQTAKRSVI